MAYEIGTASGYTDLLERLKEFISDPTREIGDHPNMTELVAIDSDIGSADASQVWTIERWEDDRNSAGEGEIEMITMGPGSGDDEIYVGIKSFSSVGSDYYDWYLEGYTGYLAIQDFDNQPGAIGTTRPRMLLHNSSLPYWMFANGRRFMVITYVEGSSYECCYMGWILPYATPSQHPYPLVIGGSSNDDQTRYSQQTDYHTAFFQPAVSGSSSTLKMLYSVWYTWGGSYQKVWPYQNITGYSDNERFIDCVPAVDDSSYSIFPMIMYSSSAASCGKNVWGELQGIFAVNAYGALGPQDTLTINGDTYIVFRNTYRSGNTNYFCVKKE